MLRFWRGRTGNAVLIESELEALSDWAERHWPAMADTAPHLPDAFERLLRDGAAHARGIEALEPTSNAVIARALVRGIARARTHNPAELERQLGVPFPPEGTT